MNQTKILILLSFLLVSASVGTGLAFASSSEDDEPQGEENSQPSQDTQQSQVTWRTFNDREGLATVQYPSTWTPSGPLVVSGPIDIVFSSPGSDQENGAEIEFIQYEAKSPFSTARESLESEMAGVPNDPANTNLEIERPIECSKYTLNGLPACSIIFEVDVDRIPRAIMVVDALADDGTEYEVYYRSDFESFEPFLPITESMINSFKTTGSSPASDFALGGGSNTTNQQNTNSSSDDDFSLS